MGITNLVNLLYTFPFGTQIVSFLMWIDSVGLWLISFLFRIFVKLAQQELFNTEIVSHAINNIYIIISVIALFLVAYELLLLMVNPDAKDKAAGNVILGMIRRFVTALIVIALLPTMFGFLLDFQNAIISQGTISKTLMDSESNITEETLQNLEKIPIVKEIIGEGLIRDNDPNLTSLSLWLRSNEFTSAIMNGLMYPLDENKPLNRERVVGILGPQVVYTYDNGYEWQTGITKNAAASVRDSLPMGGCVVPVADFVSDSIYNSNRALGLVFSALFCPVKLVEQAIDTAVDIIPGVGVSWTNIVLYSQMTGDFGAITVVASDVVDGQFHYTPIITTIVIFYIVYILIGFCIDIVVRQAKLLFYQMIAPICLLVGVLPSQKDMLKNWVKLVLLTYLELFIRIGLILALVLFVSSINWDVLSLWHPIMSVFIIIGLATFVKSLPKILKDLFPKLDASKISFSLKDRLKEAGVFTAFDYARRGVAAAGSAVGGYINGGEDFREKAMAAARAGRSGWKNKNFKAIGAEEARARDFNNAVDVFMQDRNVTKEEAKKKARSVIRNDKFRSYFGQDSTADRTAREIEEKERKIRNNTETRIEITDDDGKVIERLKKKAIINVDRQREEQLKAQKIKNTRDISASTEKLRVLKERQDRIGIIMKGKSDYKGEIDAKIDEEGSKVIVTTQYQDDSGVMRTYRGTWAEFTEFAKKNLTKTEQERIDMNKVREHYRKEFSESQMKDVNDNKLKQVKRSMFDNIINTKGVDYHFYTKDATGNIVEKKGKVTVDKKANGEYEVTYLKYGENPNNNGIVEWYKVTETTDDKNTYEIINAVDALAKGTNNYLSGESQREKETVIDKKNAQNAAIDSILKQTKEERDAELQSVEHRGQEAVKNYRAKNGDK